VIASKFRYGEVYGSSVFGDYSKSKVGWHAVQKSPQVLLSQLLVRGHWCVGNICISEGMGGGVMDKCMTWGTGVAGGVSG